MQLCIYIKSWDYSQLLQGCFDGVVDELGGFNVLVYGLLGGLVGLSVSVAHGNLTVTNLVT